MRRRGVTVSELLVVSSLLFVLMGITFVLLERATRSMRYSEAYASVQGQVHRVSRNLTRELASSVDRWTISGDYIRFLSARPVNDETGVVIFDPNNMGRIRWRKWVCYYLNKDRQEVFRSQIPLLTETSDLGDEPMPRPLVTSFETVKDRRAVAQHIEKFSVVPAAPYTYDIEVEAVVMASVPGRNDAQKEARVRLVSRVVLINRWQ